MKDELQPFLDKVIQGNSLTENEARDAFKRLAKSQNSASIAAFLTALHAKGESVEEMVGATKAVLEVARPFPTLNRPVADIVGTGGDGKQTYNVSTLAALTVAAAGVPVAKHGNRAASSRCGSADLLERFGLELELSEAALVKQLEALSFAFLFAPHYHAAFKHVTSVRKSLGFRTLFNLLGPLTNPAKPAIRLIGVFDAAWIEPMARALSQLGCERAWVVHGGGGSDELDLEGTNQICSLQHGVLERLTLTAEQAGLSPASLASIQGGDAECNTKESELVLQGKPGALQDHVALNAGAALYLAGKSANLQESVSFAAHLLADGRPWTLVQQLKKNSK